LLVCGAIACQAEGTSGEPPGPDVNPPLAGTAAPLPGAGTGGAPSSSAGMGSAGSGGTTAPVAGSGNMGGAGAGSALTTEECLAGLMAAGMTVTACEMCACAEANCLDELDAVKDDLVAAAMIMCVQDNGCSDQCCLCNAPCDPLGGNYGMGPCTTQIETAAGVTPGAGALVNGLTVMMVCSPTGPAENSCAKAARVGECIATSCAAMCPSMTACM
jgi:hypothetical protein